MRRLALVIGLTLALCGSAVATETRTVITRADDLPRISYPFSGNVVELLNDPQRLGIFIDKAQAEISGQLERFDIQDVATVRGYLNSLRTFDVLAGRDSAALEKVLKVRELQEKPAERLTSGMVTEAYLLARMQTGPDASAIAERFRQIYQTHVFALPWNIVQDEIKSTNGLFQYLSEGLMLGGLETALQNSVNQSGELRMGDISSLANTRMTLDAIFPLRNIIVEVTRAYIDANEEEKADIWQDRDVDISNRSNLTPVIIAIHDSGVDADIFLSKAQMWLNLNEVADGTDTDGNGFVDDLHGIAYDLDSRRTHGDLYPLDDAQLAIYADNLDLIKGLSDLQNAIDSDEASLARNRLSQLASAEYQEFIETFGLFGNYVHGTHVAGIAAAGNPAARILNARITFGHEIIPSLPTIEEAVRGAQSARDSIEYFRKAGVRIVNMSWGGSQAGYEYALQAHGVGDNPDQRAEIARILFGIGYKALVDAMRSAPEILFIPAAGNSDSDVDFHEVIPSSIDLPNVLVVGAVDQAGDETSFTSYGRNIRAHANGFNVDSYVPGGRRLPLSGTSMSAPNVANLAAKLLAIDPSLTPAEVISLIRLGQDVTDDGRRFLINPRRSIAILDARLRAQ